MLDISPLFISLKVSIIAILIVALLGLVIAGLCIRVEGHLRWILDALFTLPMVLPPTVIGFILLMLVGKNSGLGRLLERIQLSLIFTQQGAILAATIVSFPLMYRSAKGAFEQVDQDIIWAARSLGLSELSIFIKVIIPEAWPGIMSGIILAFVRALGEFGATIMIAGSIPGVTQTIPLTIYFSTINGKTTLATLWTIIITIISCLMLALLNRYNRR